MRRAFAPFWWGTPILGVLAACASIHQPRRGAVRCGICTPGMLLAAHVLLQRPHRLSADDVREGLAGNLCRCTGYDKIIRAVMDAAAETQKATV